MDLNGTFSLHSTARSYLELLRLLYTPCCYLRDLCTITVGGPNDDASCTISSEIIFGKQCRNNITPLISLLLNYVSIQEAVHILRQFRGPQWRCNQQVLWSGVSQQMVQRWADDHSLQTLTAAMGPLKNKHRVSPLRSRKERLRWSKYMKGASAMFAWCVSQGERCALLCRPPEQRFHPLGISTYQSIEEPILKGLYGSAAISQITVYHPDVADAKDFGYQLWPADNVEEWVRRYGDCKWNKKRAWRLGKCAKVQLASLGAAMKDTLDPTNSPQNQLHKGDQSKTKNIVEKSKKQSYTQKKLKKRGKPVECGTKVNGQKRARNSKEAKKLEESIKLGQAQEQTQLEQGKQMKGGKGPKQGIAVEQVAKSKKEIPPKQPKNQKQANQVKKANVVTCLKLVKPKGRVEQPAQSNSPNQPATELSEKKKKKKKKKNKKKKKGNERVGSNDTIEQTKPNRRTAAN
jgi:hypothetical protein